MLSLYRSVGRLMVSRDKVDVDAQDLIEVGPEAGGEGITVVRGHC